MFVRRKPNKSGTTSVQVVDKSRGSYRVVKSFGTDKTEAELLSLECKARVYVNSLKGPSLFGCCRNCLVIACYAFNETFTVIA